MRFIIFCILVSLSVASLSAQKPSTEKPTRNIEALKKLKKEIDEDYARQQKELKDYLLKNEFIMPKVEGVAILDGMLNGKPVMTKTTNVGSYRTLGAETVSPSGSLGLDLGGENLDIVIWDGGAMRTTHQEFRGRVNRLEVVTVDNHATHVGGTLIASGIDPNAKGFLYKAKIRTYDFSNDISEITNELINNDVQLSNHSYSRPTGWNDGFWLGDSEISELEDWRSGFYQNDSRNLDNITFNAPYYCMVVATGNARGAGGQGHPTNGPYDLLGEMAVTKNLFAIGAVNKLQGEYATSTDVVMSSFSNWGPTDDGRIKPDFVAPGVGLYSPFSESDTEYGSLSGTSMASPSAAGAIGLVNEAYFVFNNKYLKSATIKALLAQTVRDAGSAPGPDYAFGWGLIAVDRAVDMILEEDGINKVISENTIQSGGQFEIELNPVENSKITATIAWTDPGGTPAAISLDPTDLMLVNDLDMRIIDDNGNEVMPWILNPVRPTDDATKGDNFRDNIEKIEFEVTQPKRYFLRISHKGSLVNGSQDFSLALEYESEEAGVENIYWVGNSGSANSATHWSETSGGSAGQTPSVNSKLVIDNNSFSASGNTITLMEDLTVNGVLALTSNGFDLDLGGKTLTIQGSGFLNSPNYNISNGTLVFANPAVAKNFTIDLNGSQLSGVDLFIGSENKATWAIKDATFDLQTLFVGGGKLEVENSQLAIEGISLSNGGNLNLVTTAFSNLREMTFNKNAVFNGDASNVYNFSQDGPFAIGLNGQTIKGVLNIVSADGSINGDDGGVGRIIMSGGSLQVIDGLSVAGDLIVLDASTLIINNDQTLRAGGDFSVGDGSVLKGQSTGKGVLELTKHTAYCFDNLTVQNLDLTGSAAVGVGTSSTVTNSTGWFEGACGDLLFADFAILNDCSYALTTLKNESKGQVASTSWFVDGDFVSNQESTTYTFEDTLAHTVKIIVEDQSGFSNEYENEIVLAPAVQDSNYIIQNSTSLVSFKSADSYQWYKNNQPIANATGRVWPYDGDKAMYFVVGFSNGCNRKSTVLDLTTAIEYIDAPDSEEKGVQISPVPASDFITVTLEKGIFSKYTVRITEFTGRVVLEQKDLTQRELSLDVSDLPSGMYLLRLVRGDDELIKKVVINR